MAPLQGHNLLENPERAEKGAAIVLLLGDHLQDVVLSLTPPAHAGGESVNLLHLFRGRDLEFLPEPLPVLPVLLHSLDGLAQGDEGLHLAGHEVLRRKVHVLCLFTNRHDLHPALFALEQRQHLPADVQVQRLVVAPHGYGPVAVVPCQEVASIQGQRPPDKICAAASGCLLASLQISSNRSESSSICKSGFQP